METRPLTTFTQGNFQCFITPFSSNNFMLIAWNLKRLAFSCLCKWYKIRVSQPLEECFCARVIEVVLKGFGFLPWDILSCGWGCKTLGVNESLSWSFLRLETDRAYHAGRKDWSPYQKRLFERKIFINMLWVARLTYWGGGHPWWRNSQDFFLKNRDNTPALGEFNSLANSN